MRKLLALDLSTNSTGTATFDIDSRDLISTKLLRPKVEGLHKMRYPESAYYKIVSISEQVMEVALEEEPEHIVIEEINNATQRIGQKSLSALHYFVLANLCLIDPNWLSRVKFIDSNGAKGWRGILGLKLSNFDKNANKLAREFNRKNKAKIKHGELKAKHIVDWKVLAERYVNDKFGTEYDVLKNSTDSDICDAIAVGCAALKAFL